MLLKKKSSIVKEEEARNLVSHGSAFFVKNKNQKIYFLSRKIVCANKQLKNYRKIYLHPPIHNMFLFNLLKRLNKTYHCEFKI